MKVFEGNKVLLRALEPKDIDFLFLWENTAENWQVSGTLIPFSHFVLEQYMATAHLDIYTTKQFRFMIETLADKKTIGCIDLFEFDPKNKRAGVGILIGDVSSRCKGYASEALSLLQKYAFEILDLHQLYCTITTDNDHSLQLFQKHKFEITGCKKEWIFKAGKWLDEYTLQLLGKI
jgi:diamine N-acetyltransferase